MLTSSKLAILWRRTPRMHLLSVLTNVNATFVLNFAAGCQNVYTAHKIIIIIIII